MAAPRDHDLALVALFYHLFLVHYSMKLDVATRTRTSLESAADETVGCQATVKITRCFFCSCLDHTGSK